MRYLLILGALAMSLGTSPAVANEAIRPFLVECRKCARETVRDTGNSTSGGGKVIAERQNCRHCTIEFRTDKECAVPPIPGVN